MSGIDYKIALSGRAASSVHQPVWTLPHGARPVSDLYFTQPSSVGPVTVTVMADGSILVSDVTERTEFDGIVFEAAHV